MFDTFNATKLNLLVSKLWHDKHMYLKLRD